MRDRQGAVAHPLDLLSPKERVFFRSSQVWCQDRAIVGSVVNVGMIGLSSARCWASQTTVKRQSSDRPFCKPLFSQGKRGESSDSQPPVKRHGPFVGRLPGCVYPSDHSVSARTQEARKTTIAAHTEDRDRPGQGDRNRPLVMKCDCPDGCLSPCGVGCCVPNIVQPSSCNHYQEAAVYQYRATDWGAGWERCGSLCREC